MRYWEYMQQEYRKLDSSKVKQEPKFKVGDKVIIKDNSGGHGFGIWDIVTLEKDNGDNWTAYCPRGISWYIDEDDFEPVSVGNFGLNDDEPKVELTDAVKILAQDIKDNVNKPSHYGQGSIEAIEYIKDFLNDDEFQGYLRGNIAKYLHRFPYKNGLEDLKKAQVYLGWLIEHKERT